MHVFFNNDSKKKKKKNPAENMAPVGGYLACGFGSFLFKVFYMVVFNGGLKYTVL